MIFKAHKYEKDNDKKNAMHTPVNDIGFNSRAINYFYTCDSAGRILYWDFAKKNKIKEFYTKRTAVCKARCSPNGLYIAIGIGYDWNKGIEGLTENHEKRHSVLVRKIDY